MDGELFTTLIIIAPILLVIVWQVAFKTSSNPRRLPYPPGPRPLPILGNLYDIPKRHPWRGYNLLSQTFGDVYFLQTPGQSILVLGSVQAAKDLLDRRSAIYSDRMRIPMLSLTGWDLTTPFMPYGQFWRDHRREFQEYFHSAAVGGYAAAIEEQMLKFLRALLNDPENFSDLLHLWFGATMMKIVYDFDIEDRSNERLRVTEKALESLAQVVVPGNYWVDFIPILEYVPEWMPGAGFKRQAAKWKYYNAHSRTSLWQDARSAWSEDKAPVSIVDKMLDKVNQHPDQVNEEVLANTAAVSYGAGLETSLSTVQFFFLAMAVYPDVQRKAQQELDNVVGPDRLARSDDRASLPYIEAMVRESFRWQPAFPLGIPHRTVADDEYRGYFIPKGTAIIANQWAMLHDPAVYPDPERYNPDRYIKDGKLDPLAPDPRMAAFGFGRRICPGRYFAEKSMLLFFASVLHVFEISAPVDEHGQRIQLQAKMTDAGLSFPEPYNCIIKPRSPSRAALFQET